MKRYRRFFLPGMLAACALPVTPAVAQSYPIDIKTNALPAGASGAALSAFLPGHTSRTLDFNLCFYTGFGNLQPITPSSYILSSTGATTTFAVPASAIQEVPPESFTNGSFDAVVYTVPQTVTACSGAEQALGNQAAITLNNPHLASLSLASLPQRNPNLASPMPGRLSLSGAYFLAAAASGVTFSSSTTLPGDVTFISPTSLVSTIPADIPEDATSVSVAVCNTAKYSYCSASVTLTLTPLQTAAATLTAKPAPATSLQDVTLSASFTPPAITVAGAPGGPVTFADGGTTLGLAPMILDTTARLHSAPPRGFTVRESPLKPTVADFNRDAIPDVIFIEPGNPSGGPAYVHLLLGTTPTGDFAKDIAFKGFGGKQPCATIVSAAAADFNGDGFTDVALLCENAEDTQAEVLYTLLGKGDGTFSLDSSPNIPVFGRRLVAGDFNRDGTPDLLVLGKLNAADDTGVQLLIGNNTGHFLPGPMTGGLSTGPGPAGSQDGYDLAVADLNGDGYLDLAVMNAIAPDGSATGYVAFFENDQAGGFIASAATLPAAIAGHPQLLLAPLRKGNQPSVILSLNDSVQVSANKGTSSIAFDPPATTEVPGLLMTTAADFNGDGLLDLAVAENKDNLEYVLNGDGLGHFKRSYPGMKVSMVAAPNLLDAIDENGDGYADLLVGWLATNASGTTTQNLRSFLAAGSASATLLTQRFAPGTHSITATTPGTFTTAGSSAQTTLTVTTARTTLSLTTFPVSSAPYGLNPVQLRADIPDPTATGTVSFYHGDTLLGTSQLATSSHSADAILSPSLLPAGRYSFRAVYGGDANHPAATSPAVSFQITPVPATITWHPDPAILTYGTPLSAAQLDATASVPGVFTYTPSLGAVLAAGARTLTVLFTPNDSVNYTAAQASVTIAVNRATPNLAWPPPGDVAAGTPLSSAQLDATATGIDGLTLSGSFAYTPDTGAVLSVGTHTLSVLFTPTDVVDYAPASASVSLRVITVSLTSIAPAAALLGDDDTPISLTGNGFLPGAVVQMNGTPVPTTFIDHRTLTAVIPASDFNDVQTLFVSVLEAPQGLTSNALPFTVIAPATTVVSSGPASISPNSQPIYDFKINPYPVRIKATFTLRFSPSSGLPSDPTVVFSNGLQSLPVDVPRKTTDILVQFQSGTVAGTLTLTPALVAGGAIVTPASLQPLVIEAPTAVPGITSTRLTRDGNLLTVVTRGYSNTRLMTMAKFHFTPATGKSLRTSDLNVDVAALFANWYASPESIQYGSQFTYTQTFNLSTDAEAVGNVTVTLANDVGESPEATTP